MPAPNKAFLTPIRFTEDEAAAQFVEVFTTGPTTELVQLPVSAGVNYWLSGDGEVTRDGEMDLFQVFLDALNLQVTAGPFLFTLDHATNRGTWVLDSFVPADFSFHWGEGATTIDPAIFGFTAANTALNDTTTAPNTTKGIWLPEVPCLYDGFDDPQMVGTVVPTQGGGSRASSHDDVLYHRDIEYHLLDGEHSITHFTGAARPYNQLEYAWVSGRWGKGCDVRVYDDATTRTVSSFKTYRVRPPTKNPWRRQIKNQQLYFADLKFIRIADFYVPEVP